ncbi:hypothetical protein M2150_002708 [Lachnospiraceae bacterium PM6-15]
MANRGQAVSKQFANNSQGVFSVFTGSGGDSDQENRKQIDKR